MPTLTIRWAAEVDLGDGTLLVLPGSSLTLPLETIVAPHETPSEFELMRVIAPFIPGRSRPSFDAVSITGWLFQGEQIRVGVTPIADTHGVMWRRVFQPGHSADGAYLAERLGTTLFLATEASYATMG